MAGTSIEWATHVWNPSTGCDRISPGCDNCYALKMAARLKAMGQEKSQRDGDPNTSGPGFGVSVHPDELTAPLRWRKPRLVFVNSMSDLFHQDVPDEFIARVWAVMAATPQHTYQILTKRHGRMRSWVNRWYSGEIAEPYQARPVAGFPGYSVTTLGEVLGKRRDTTAGLSQEIGELGHRRVTMHREGSPRSGERRSVSRLVLETFARTARPGEQACHRSGDTSDNRLSNLYWGTQEINWSDRIRHGNGRSWSKLTADDVATIRARCAAGESAYKVAQDYPVSDTQIRNVVRGDQWAPTSPPEVVRAPARSVFPSVWLGVSVEDQKRADLRIPALLETPAAVRFLSCEPLLGPVTIRSLQPWQETGEAHHSHPDWIIAGGESGPGARPMHPDWARSLRDQCTAAGVPFLFKQWGSWTSDEQNGARWADGRAGHHLFVTPEGVVTPGPAYGPASTGMRRTSKKEAGRVLDGRTWDEYPSAVPA